MNLHRRYQIVFATGAAVLALFAVACARRALWWEAVMFGVVALFMAEGAARSGHAARAAAGTGPCCGAYTASRGAVHAAYCHTHREDTAA